jgi:hypothetical protein
MIKPTLPGFSAEISLYKSSGYYHMVGTVNALAVSTVMIDTVHPAQAIRLPPIFDSSRMTLGLGLSACEFGCDLAYGACTFGCSGLTGGIGIAACIAGCTLLYELCKDGCK